MQLAPRFETARGDGIDLHLALWDGQGPPVVCIHGLTANCRCWDPVARQLSPWFRVAAPDLRGRGRSGRPPHGYSVARHVADLEGLLDHLGLESAVIMGHSLGAVITLAFAAHHPERVTRAVLWDGGGRLSEAETQRVFEGIQPVLQRLAEVYADAEAYLQARRQTPYLQPWSLALETYFRYELETVPDGVRANIQVEHILEEIQQLGELDVAALYPRVRCPLLILRALRGLLTPDDILLPERAVDEMRRQMPQLQCVDLPGANHYSVLFHPNAVRDFALREFLRPVR
jgi:pimeloyl-ACP methyl ester carboxylesterase